MADPGRTYEEEQGSLQKEVEGEDADFSAPQAFPEVNPEVYRDVDPMLFHGFLTQSAEINDVLFVFKSINHHEFELIRLMAGGTTTKNYNDLFLTFGVLMVDGQNMLKDRDKLQPELVSFFKELPVAAKQKVIRYLSEINRRAYQAVILTEAYTMESVSRLRWAQLHEVDLTSTAVSGIPGTSVLGMNWAQLMWRALNYFEDLKGQYEADWENTKFIAGATVGKGMSKIHSSDRSRKEKDRTEKITRRDRILRHVLLGEAMDGPSNGVGGQVLTVANTVPELSEQLKADLRGEKDWHDQVIEAHEQRVRQGYEDKAAALRAVAERHREEFEGKPLLGGTDLTQGLSSQEVQARLLRHRQLNAQRAASQIVYPELYDERHTEFMDKWNIPRAETVTETDRDPSTAVPLPAAKPGSTTWRGR